LQNFPRTLLEGYRIWRDGELPQYRGRLAQLAALGQSPRAMVIGCCDSRVSPEAIFTAGLGELFVVRNVAGVVPPYRPDNKHHGTSAAIEFALLGLSVPNIIVMGHSRCGGIKAYIESSFDPERRGDFIGPWMDLVSGAKEDAIERNGPLEGVALERAVEEAAIRHSIENLRTFPEIKRREDEGTLIVHGVHLDVANGDLRILDHASGDFLPAYETRL
jgi:carbonic anhydrase